MNRNEVLHLEWRFVTFPVDMKSIRQCQLPDRYDNDEFLKLLIKQPRQEQVRTFPRMTTEY